MAIKKLNYIGIVEHNIMAYGYAWLSLLTNNKIILYGENNKGINKFLKNNILFESDDIGTIHGEWYKIQKYIVCESKYLENLKIENNLLLKIQCIIFSSPKVNNFYKQYFSNIEYKMLRDKILAQRTGRPFCFVLPYLYSYRILARSYLNKDQYKYSLFLTILFLLFGVTQLGGSILKTLLVKPVWVKIHKALVLNKISWKFGGKGLKGDMLVDGKALTKKDFLFYYESYSTKKDVFTTAKEAKLNGFNVLTLDNTFNLNKCYTKAMVNNFLFAIVFLFFSLITSPYLLFGFKNLNSKTFNLYKLFSFIDVKYYWSVGNWHDIAETVVANNFNVRSFMYSWSDYAQSYLYPFIYTVHDDVFMWGPIEKKYMMRKSLHENMFAIGCLFSNNYIEKKKKNVFDELKLNMNSPVVVFYDSPVNNSMRYPQNLFDEFRDIIMIVEAKYPDIQIVLKPKVVTNEYKGFFKNSSVKLVDSTDIYLGDIINIATLNIGMGIVAPITISLIMNKPGIFFDTAGNYDSPFAKYEDELVFRSKDNLLRKIDQILNCKADPINILELKDYNVPYTDPVDILREYIITGRVNEKYRV
jgi:hypothetical protein